MAERPNLDEDKGGKLMILTRFRAKPTDMHLTAIKRIYRYLKMEPFTWVCGILRTPSFLGHRLVSWSIQKAKRNCQLTTTEAEYFALSGCSSQIPGSALIYETMDLR
ncbi:hypothetical protein Tco_0785261 [Tanacetum coccineum]